MNFSKQCDSTTSLSTHKLRKNVVSSLSYIRCVCFSELFVELTSNVFDQVDHMFNVSLHVSS